MRTTQEKNKSGSSLGLLGRVHVSHQNICGSRFAAQNVGYVNAYFHFEFLLTTQTQKLRSS